MGLLFVFPFLIVLGIVVLWYLCTIVFGVSVGNTAKKLKEEFVHEMHEKTKGENKNE